MNHPRLILASTSVYRKSLLERIGINAECRPPGIDEDQYKKTVDDPLELAIKLAHAKAAAVSQANPDAIVIGADQLATIDGLILGKPGTPENAVQQLLKLSGRTHLLVTAMHVISPDGRNQQVLDQSQLTMRRLSKEALARYVALDRPIDCAGSYKLEAAGIALFEQIQTQDHTAITGLPLLSLVRILEGLNYPVP